MLSVLIQEWCSQNVESKSSKLETSAVINHPPSGVFWLALDPEDNDPSRFFSYLSAALDPIKPGLYASIQAILQSPGASPAVKVAFTYLINALNEHVDPGASLTRQYVLILDDYHAIDSRAVHEAFTFLLDHLPDCLRVIIASRTDPPLSLARWWARDQLVELRADDLRFTADEATSFLNQIMGLSLSTEQIATLETRTEGWIAGLQLAALALQTQTDSPGFIDAFGGSNRQHLEKGENAGPDIIIPMKVVI